MYNLTENYLTNVDEVLTLAKKYDHFLDLKVKMENHLLLNMVMRH